MRFMRLIVGVPPSGGRDVTASLRVPRVCRRPPARRSRLSASRPTTVKAAVFRRNSSEPTSDPRETAVSVEAKPGGKGRPTPTRKEAEAAARAKARLPKDKKAAAKLLRERRAAENAKMRD